MGKLSYLVIFALTNSRGLEDLFKFQIESFHLERI